MGHKLQKHNRPTTISVYTCDWCSKVIRYASIHPLSCDICKRYACDEHQKGWRDTITTCDYCSIWICHECQNIGKPYIEAMEKLDLQIEHLREEWHSKARQAAEAAKESKDE